MDLKRLSFNPEDTPWVAVSLQRTTACNLHSGIFYRDANRNLFHLHFAWHRDLRNEPCSGNLACCIPILDEADQLWLSGFCGKIAKLAPQKNIPYNLKHDESVLFNPITGAISFGPDSTGLGCATFVLAVFRSAGLRLIDMAGWPPPTTADKQVRQGLMFHLAASNDPDQQAQAKRVQKEIDEPRVRPDHVSGACLEATRDVKYPECEANGIEVVKLMDANFAPATQPAPASGSGLF